MNSNKRPFVSVIMPIRNEEKYIRRSLGAVLCQDYPHDRLEVILADGISSDRTREFIAELQNKHSDVQVLIIDNPEQTVPYGFNYALNASQGDIVVRVDGHTIVDPDYVSQVVELLLNSGCDNVGGRMNAQGENFFAKVVSAATSSPFGVGGARFHYSQKEELVDTVYMGAWKREVFERIGGFDTRFKRSQDSEFNYRLRAHGGKILLSPKIRSTYYTRTSFKKLWNQYYQ
ncbi:MAG: glycosyltransferase family 2 protein, partial [Anaerolineae bacterium]|nr:glycosyltransferase family 2 protein [Anaerolineae bacterium]